MHNRLPFQRAMRISRSERDVDGVGGPSTGEGLVGTSLEAGTFGR